MELTEKIEKLREVSNEMKAMAKILSTKETSYEKALAFLCAVKWDTLDDVEYCVEEYKKEFIS